MTHLAIASDFARGLVDEQFPEYSREARARRATRSGSARVETAGHRTQEGSARPARPRGVLSRLVQARG
jgi:hypothetical protein